MRRKEREIYKLDEIENILQECKICRIGMLDHGKPYIIPMNFGYELTKDGALMLYFHCATEGRKLCALQTTPEVCFEMDCGHETFGKTLACTYSFAYASIIGEGCVQFIESEAEKRYALDHIMTQATGRVECWKYNEKMLQSTCVFRITSNHFTAKCQKKNDQSS